MPEQTRAQAPVHVRPRRRRTPLVVAAALAVGIGGVFVYGMQSGSQGGQDGGGTGAKLTAAGVVSCADVIAQGRISGIEKGRGGDRVELTVAVREYLKPRDRASRKLEVTTAGGPDLREGAEVAVVVIRDEPIASVYAGEEGQQEVDRLRPHAEKPDTLPRCEGTG